MSGFKPNIGKNIMMAPSDFNFIYKYNLSNQVEYIMVAFPWNEKEKRKTRESDAAWQIVRYTYNGNYVTEMAHAEGKANFMHQASKYLDYNYDID
jgi:hypothetical protein